MTNGVGHLHHPAILKKKENKKQIKVGKTG